jgi:hypothetical protein
LILGDFNKDQRNRKKSKIADILIKYDMIHLTNDATDVSESSSLVIYLDPNIKMVSTPVSTAK